MRINTKLVLNLINEVFYRLDNNQELNDSQLNTIYRILNTVNNKTFTEIQNHRLFNLFMVRG